jgi:carbon monoxide dehydrogenase subunit G
VLAAALDLAAAAAHGTQFDVTRDGATFHVAATADLGADPGVVWDTLTDYEDLPRFVPGIRSARVLERRAEGRTQRLLVEQVGELRFLFFVQRVSVRLDVRHEPRARIDARAVARGPGPGHAESGLDEFEGTYELVKIPGGVRLGYRARFAPAFPLPPLIGTLAVRQTMKRQFDALLSEIERRQTALRPAGGVP